MPAFALISIVSSMPGVQEGGVCVCVLSRLSCVRLFATLGTIAHQAPLAMKFSRQEYWSGLLCLPPGDLPNSGIESVSPALAGRVLHH